MEIAEKTKERAKIAKEKLTKAMSLRTRMKRLRNDSSYLSSNFSI
jgi:hypothetical protein